MKRRAITEVYEKNVSGSRSDRKQGISDKPGGRISSRINNKGMGTVEMILIIVVLIGLVLIFKTQIMELTESIFQKIAADSSAILA